MSPLRIENKTGYQLQQIFRVMIRKPEWAASALSGCCSMSAKPDHNTKNKQVNPLPRRGASIRNDRRKW